MTESNLRPPTTTLAATSVDAFDLSRFSLVFVRAPADNTLVPPPKEGAWVLLEENVAYLLEETPLRSLFRGTYDPGSFGSTPPPEYDRVFACIEAHLGRIVTARGSRFRDEEALELFSAMRRRPDGRYQSPLYLYFRAVLRVLLLRRPTSEREFDAILARLERSARTFRKSATSTNYYDHVIADLLGDFTGAQGA